MIIKVKEKHINNGIPKDPSFCPITLALIEAFPTYRHISTGLSIAQFWTNHSTGFNNEVPLRTELPIEAIEFIINYDSKRKVGPFEFEISEPAPYPRIDQ